MRSSTPRWRGMSDAWLCTLTPSSAERAQAGRWPSRENHHLVLTKRVSSCSFLTCSHLRASRITPTLRRPLKPVLCVSATATELRLQAGAFPIRKLLVPLSLLHNCQRPSLSFTSLPNLSATLALRVDVCYVAVVLELLFLLLMYWYLFIKLLLWLDSVEKRLELNRTLWMKQGLIIN